MSKQQQKDFSNVVWNNLNTTIQEFWGRLPQKLYSVLIQTAERTTLYFSMVFQALETSLQINVILFEGF